MHFILVCIDSYSWDLKKLYLSDYNSFIAHEYYSLSKHCKYFDNKNQQESMNLKHSYKSSALIRYIGISLLGNLRPIWINFRCEFLLTFVYIFIIWIHHHDNTNRCSKGQLILERNFGVFKSPKKWTKFCKNFCPSL